MRGAYGPMAGCCQAISYPCSFRLHSKTEQTTQGSSHTVSGSGGLCRISVAMIPPPPIAVASIVAA